MGKYRVYGFWRQIVSGNQGNRRENEHQPKIEMPAEVRIFHHETAHNRANNWFTFRTHACGQGKKITHQVRGMGQWHRSPMPIRAHENSIYHWRCRQHLLELENRQLTDMSGYAKKEPTGRAKDARQKAAGEQCREVTAESTLYLKDGIQRKSYEKYNALNDRADQFR